MSRFQSRLVHRQSSRHDAFTRTELAVLLAALVLVAMVVLPALANTGQRAQRLTCVSNLREIGQSFIAWSSEFGNRLPMQVPVTEGGTWNHALGNNAWFQFYTLSNHVRTPRIFVCPSDPEKRPADSLVSVSFDGGFIHVTYRNNALSYVIGHPLIEARPDILSADRNLAGSFLGGGCAYWFPSRSIPRTSIGAAWTDTLHDNSGNVLFGDGRVEQLSSLGLRQRLAEGTSEGNTEFHYLAP